MIPAYKRKWTPEQIHTLLTLWNANVTLAIISKRLGMPQGEVSTKAKELNLPPRNLGGYKPKK